MLINWAWSGWTGKYLAFRHDAQTSLKSVIMTSSQIFCYPALPLSQ